MQNVEKSPNIFCVVNTQQDFKGMFGQFFSIFHDRVKLRKRTTPANISLLKVNNGNTRKRREICSKLTIKTPERRQ